MNDAKQYRFMDGGGGSIVDGKVHYPAHLTVEMDRSTAWRLMQALMVQLRDDDVPIEFTFSGVMREDDNER